MFTVYILKSQNFPKFYTGQTNNLELRLKQHNAGNSTYSSRYGPWKVVYTEQLASREEAVAREKYLKTAAGRRWIKKQMKGKVN